MLSRTRYKGRFIKDKVLAQKEKCRKGLAEKCREQRNLQNDEARNLICEGTCIVDLNFLGKNLKCQKCQQTLSLENMKSESRKGLHSILAIECQKCLILTHVHTGNYHSVNEEAKRFLRDQEHNDITTNAVLGTSHAAVERTELNKILTCLDVPTITSNLFRKYEQEVGPAIQGAAKRSCRSAALDERKLVIEKMEELYTEL